MSEPGFSLPSPNVTLRQLRAFSAVADLGSFTEAARQLHLTQSALSVLVRELERELGVRLLDRNTRRVQLSAAGRDLYPYVQRLQNELANAMASVSSLRDRRKGFLRVAAPQMMAGTLMPRAIAAFRELCPHVEVVMSDTPPEQTLERLIAGDVELAVSPVMPSSADLYTKPLLRDLHFLICQEGMALAEREVVRWEDLRDAAFIAPTRDFMKRLRPELVALDPAHPALALVPVHEVSFMTTALGMAASGLGVTSCPSYCAPLVKAYGLVMRPLVEPQFYREVAIHAIRNVSLSPAAEAFVEFLSEYVEREGVRMG